MQGRTTRRLTGHFACEKLGFYEFTKLYDTADCCMVFQPSNPVLHVQKEALARAVAKLDEAGMQAVLQEAFARWTIYDASDDKDLILPAVPTPPQACPFVPKQSRQAAATAGNPNEALKPNNHEQDAPMATAEEASHPACRRLEVQGAPMVTAAAEEVSKQNTKQDTPITATNNHEQDTPITATDNHEQDTPMATAEEASHPAYRRLEVQGAPMVTAAAEEGSKQNTKQDTPVTATAEEALMLNNHEQDTPMATAEEASKHEADLTSKQDTYGCCWRR